MAARPPLPPQAAARLAQVKPWSIPSRALPRGRGAGAGAGAGSIANTGAMSMREVSKLPRDQRPNCLLIQVPNSVLPSDVLRALKEVRAVDGSFTQGSLTPYPLGAARKASLHTQYHITARTPAMAEDMHRLLSSRPLFAASSVAAGPLPTRPIFGIDAPRQFAAVGFTKLDARNWAAALLARADRMARGRSSVKAWDTIDVDWALNPALSGRRVLVRGLPVNETYSGVRDLAGDLAVDTKDAIVRLPPQPWSAVSCWSVTCPSVARAHDLARHLNMNYYLQTQHGHKFPMRAHVVW